MSVVARRFHDRAGNNLSQYCHARSYAERIGAELQTDSWWGQRVFGLTEKPISRDLPLRSDMEFEQWDGESGIEITGWALHQKSLIYSRADVKRWLKFTDEMEALLAFVPHSKIAAHLRWGDFITMSDFIAVSRASYVKAFGQFGMDPDSPIRWVSEMEPLRSEKLIEEDLGWLPDFVALMRSENLFRANSTFSWWAATLGDAKRIFSPNLAGIQPIAGQTQKVPFVEGNWPAISCFHPNCSDLHLTP